MMDNITAEAQKMAYDPWTIPDSFTLYQFAPEDIRSFLHPYWHGHKAPHPVWFYFLGFYFLVLGIIATFGNYCVLRIFSSSPALRTPSNMLVLNLAMCDMGLMIALFPELIYNFFTGGPWRFGETACYIHSFLGALLGYCQITTLTMISWDRYNVIVKGMAGTPLTFQKSIIMILFAWIWSFVFSLMPLLGSLGSPLGWGLYAMDPMLGTCSFDGLTTSTMNKSYIMTACCLFYFFPITVIAGCYYFIVQAVFKHEDEMRQQAKKMNVTSLRSGEQNAVSAEIRIAKVAIINVSLWITAWTPFAVFCLMGTWGNPSGISPLLSELQVLLAKTSCAYNPIIYCLSHPKFRELIKEYHPWMCIVVEKKGDKGRDNQSIGSSKSEISEKSESA